MGGRHGIAGMRLAALILAALSAAAPARAQVAAACPPPKKLAAGACVTACPAGYEDRGRDCVFRSMSRLAGATIGRPTQPDKLTPVAARPIKPTYIRQLVDFVDRVRSG